MNLAKPLMKYFPPNLQFINDFLSCNILGGAYFSRSTALHTAPGKSRDIAPLNAVECVRGAADAR